MLDIVRAVKHFKSGIFPATLFAIAFQLYVEFFSHFPFLVFSSLSFSRCRVAVVHVISTKFHIQHIRTKWRECCCMRSNHRIRSFGSECVCVCATMAPTNDSNCNIAAYRFGIIDAFSISFSFSMCALWSGISLASDRFWKISIAL